LLSPLILLVVLSLIVSLVVRQYISAAVRDGRIKAWGGASSINVSSWLGTADR
jgi:hypothetical protein